MNKALLDILVEPVTRTSLRFGDDPQCDDHGRILTGSLVGGSGTSFPVVNGIPRFVLTEDAKQRQTERSFAFGWRDPSFSSTGFAFSQAWVAERYGFPSVADMRAYFGGRERILDAGCGNGFSAALWMTPDWGGRMWVGADISTAVDVAQKRLRAIPNTHFVQADILQLPFAGGCFDTIFSEGVLHHTPSTAGAFRALVDLLSPGGELMVYVYRKKGPVREFTDDYVRSVIADLDPAEALAMLRPLTHLGRALAELKAEIDLPEDIPCLGIKAGRYDVQRLVYWHFAKVFWNDAYTFEENLATNFDWYHPAYAHRHTETEIRDWCEGSGLEITRFDAADSGYTVRAVRP